MTKQHGDSNIYHTACYHYRRHDVRQMSAIRVSVCYQRVTVVYSGKVMVCGPPSSFLICCRVWLTDSQQFSVEIYTRNRRLTACQLGLFRGSAKKRGILITFARQEIASVGWREIRYSSKSPDPSVHRRYFFTPRSFCQSKD